MTMHIDPDDSEFVYMQLADEMERAIRTGHLAGRLPGEVRMARNYRVAVGTLRRALVVLRERELIRTKPTRGTFVIYRH